MIIYLMILFFDFLIILIAVFAYHPYGGFRRNLSMYTKVYISLVIYLVV